MWLAVNNRCWTADRLAKRGLPHPVVCPLCDQATETINHFLIACVFSRQVWTFILQSLGLVGIIPSAMDGRFTSWWASSSKRVPKEMRKGLNSLVILVAWVIWKERNSCVFEGSQPNVQKVLLSVRDEGLLWCMAGASKLQELLSRSLSPAAAQALLARDVGTGSV